MILAHFSNCMHFRFMLCIEYGKVFGIKTMDQAEFQDWLSASDRLTAAQRAEAARCARAGRAACGAIFANPAAGPSTR